MWGNSLGWTISALLVLLVGGWVYLIERRSSLTPRPTFPIRGELPAAADPGDAALVLPQSGADAGPMYRSAMEHVFQDRATYSELRRAWQA
jgi:hypothetical protein